MNQKVSWILASTSSRRKQLLQSIGLEFKRVSADINEYKTPPTGQPPIWVAQKNAQLKAQYVANQYPENYIIGSDTIVVFDQTVFNKPKNMADAYYMLEQLSNNTHQVITAVSVICKRNNFEKNFTKKTEVSFDPLTPNFIKHYLAAINPLDKAGAYAIQHPLSQTFAHFNQTGFTNIMGFPIEAFKKHLQHLLH